MEQPRLTNEVLALLLALKGGEAHGYALMQQVEEDTDGTIRIQTGALYRLLHRMEDNGLVALAPTPSDEPDLRRKYYRITPAGNRAASHELERMRQMVDHGRRVGILRPRGARS